MKKISENDKVENQKKESKEKLINVILFAVTTGFYGIFGANEFISQDRIPIIHIGLILVFGGQAINNYIEYRKGK